MRYTESVADLDARIRAHKLYSAATVESIVEDRLAQLAEPPLLLDLGCGNGNYYPLFAARSRQYVGIDINEPLLASFLERHRQGQLLIRASMDELPQFVSGCFDAIYAIYSIYYTEQPDRLIAELARILRSDGQLVILGPGRSPHAPEIAAFLAANGGGSAQGAPKSVRIERFHTDIVSQVERHFRDVRVEEVDTSLRFPDADEWATYVSATPEVRERLPQLDDASLQAAAAAHAGRVEGLRISKSMLTLTATR